MRLREAAITSLVWLIALSRPSAQEGLKLPTKPGPLAGFGAHPVSDLVASMWFASAPMPKSGMRPALMVYYRGPRGWLDKEVKYKADATADPAFADFQIGDLRLYLQFWAAKHLIKLFDQEVSVEANNIVVVTGVGVPSSTPSVRAISNFVDVVPDGQNPALYLLDHSPEARKALE